jgi:hypothetical protein
MREGVSPFSFFHKASAPRSSSRKPLGFHYCVIILAMNPTNHALSASDSFIERHLLSILLVIIVAAVVAYGAIDAHYTHRRSAIAEKLQRAETIEQSKQERIFRETAALATALSR